MSKRHPTAPVHPSLDTLGGPNQYRRMPAAIETRDLGKVFNKHRTIRDFLTRPSVKPGKVRALEGVSLEVRQGEIFGLLGPNGAGKTTLLKILSCLVTPSEGRATVNGSDVTGNQHRVKASIGLVTSDERSFYWRLSGRENLHFFAALYNVPREKVRVRCASLLEKMEMTAKADQPFMEYSTGTKQRLAIARALLHDPPILFMDEPTRSLDPTAAKHLREFTSKTLNKQEGKTIILATHNLPEAEFLCHRLAILHLAKVRRMGTTEEVRSWGNTRDRYAIEVHGLTPTRILSGSASADPAHAEAGGFAFKGCRIDVQSPEEAGRSDAAMILADVEKGGAALTELLRRLIVAKAVVVSCARRETSLQEVFDLVAAEGEVDAAGRAGATERPGDGASAIGRVR